MEIKCPECGVGRPLDVEFIRHLHATVADQKENFEHSLQLTKPPVVPEGWCVDIDGRAYSKGRQKAFVQLSRDAHDHVLVVFGPAHIPLDVVLAAAHAARTMVRPYHASDFRAAEEKE